MGNRAVIATSTDPKSTGIYLHWNGGVESVLAFLAAAKQLGFRDPVSNNYGVAYIQALICVFFKEGMSTGIGPIAKLDCDNGDNGMYILGDDFTIKDRIYSYDSTKSYEELTDKDKIKCDEITSHLIELWQGLK